MNKIVVAFCEEDDAYRNRFVTYLVEHKAKEIMVYAFSNANLFLEELKSRDFDVILLGNGFLDMPDILQEKKRRVLLLKETVPEKVAEEDLYCLNREPVIHSVFRYQSMEFIIHEILALSENDKAGRYTAGIIAAEKEIIGVYSFSHHEMQMPFSLVLAHLMSDKRRVLYLNLMAHSGLIELFDLAGDYDLGDIIVRLRNHRLLPEIYKKCVYEMEGISYIQPFHNPENLHELSWEDFCVLIQFIQEQTDAEMILIDFGEGLDKFSSMLKICTSIYCPCKVGYLNDCQKESFLHYLEGASDESLRNRLQLVDLPYSAKGIRRGADVLRQLIYSEFGDFVREYFAGQY